MNKEFLQAIFGRYADQAHVTDFTHDPSNIPADQHLKAWKGDYFSRYQFQPVSNQYFTISTFATDEKGVARRRKALYLRTHCIVLDDVKEKLALEQAQKLPRPSWILETSPGSEQWGYILTQLATDRHRVENLLDGLVANGLAPEGRDPGMKGVTRYVRLPDGINNKASKLVDGQPFQCRLLLWEPFNTTTLEALAAPFLVDLDAERRETRVDGAADVSNHPLLSVPDLVRIKEVRSDGRFDITCPWVDEHTGADDSGTAVFTNADGSIGFKCHHGACQGRTGRDLLRWIEVQEPGFGNRLTSWKATRMLADVSEVSFLGNVTQKNEQEDPLQQIFDAVRRERHDSPEARELVVELLKIVDELPVIEQTGWHKDICATMYWNKSEFKEILKDLRTSWYVKSKESISFFDETIFIAEANQFYDRRKRIFYSAEAYQNTYSHLDPDARKEALLGGRVTKVDKLDYAPKMPPVFEEKGVRYGNAWCNTSEEQGVEGDCSRWLEHFNILGWGAQRKHLLQWMAYTVKFPEKKINHMLTLGSSEGCGKDFLLYPLAVALGDHAHTISGEELTEDFNDYLLSTKFLLVNETELGDRKEAMAISAKLKPLAAAPPDRLRVNQKGIKKVAVRNLLSVAMTTNSQLPFRLQGQSRRIFALWSDLNVRGRDGGIKPEWHDYWSDRWDWMKEKGGAEMCVWYLRNCVDLSDFNPGTPPPMTEFLRDITEASKSTQLQTIEAFVKECAGAFASDVIMASDAVSTLKGGEMIKADLMYAPGNWFTPVKVGMLMREMHATRVRVAAGNLWIIRNHEKYEQMTGGELWQEYQNQISGVKKTTLRAVN